MKDLLSSRKLWALLLGILVLVAQHFFPNFKLDIDSTVGLVIVIVGYIVSISIDPGPAVDKLKSMLKSRKFYATLFALGMVIADGFGLWTSLVVPREQVLAVVGIVMSYVFGTAVVNNTTADPNSPSDPSPPAEPSVG